MAKLPEETKAKIKWEARFWPRRVLAKRYGVREATITEIVQHWQPALG